MGVAAGSCANAVACENALPGTPMSAWYVGPQSLPFSIDGFSTSESVDVGQTIRFKIQTTAASYQIRIYRLGWYGGDGARLVAQISPSVSLPQSQPACLQDVTTGETDCGNWAVSASWAVPSSAVSGVYVADLIRTDGTAGRYPIVFVVRDDASHSALVFQTDDETEQAYNQWGGNSLYKGTWGPGYKHRAFAVSYNRPSSDPELNASAAFFASQYPMLRWLERNGYDVSYIAGVDTAQSGSALLPQHKVFVDVGHDEYVSGDQRANIEAAEGAGVNLAYFSGNETYWKTRFAPSMDASQTPYRTLVSYKEAAVAGRDPSGIWTGIWGDTRAPNGTSGRFPNALSGTLSDVVMSPNTGYPLSVPSAYSKLRLWRNTTVAQLASGETATLGTNIVGYEWDIDADNGQRPPGTFDASATPKTSVWRLDWPTYTYGTGSATHQITEHRAPSGALVFSAGTIQWSWALDPTHHPGSSTPTPAIQQATVNILADMGAQPATLQPGLATATQTTDTTPPTTSTNPITQTQFTRGVTYTISGTAQDTGGVVAGTEISLDNGTTWHPATLTRAAPQTTWTYHWTPTNDGTYTIKLRSVDDSANLHSPQTGPTITVVG